MPVQFWRKASRLSKPLVMYGRCFVGHGKAYAEHHRGGVAGSPAIIGPELREDPRVCGRCNQRSLGEIGTLSASFIGHGGSS